MLQECQKIYWESDRADFIESVKKRLRRKKKESEQRQDSAIYIHLIFRLLSSDTARETREAIAEVMPEAVVTGMTETLYVNEDLESLLRLNITFLQRSRVKLMEYLGPPECYEEAGKTIGERISHLPMAKAVGIYSAGLSTDFHKFVSCVSSRNEEVPFFGATAGIFEFSADDRNRFSNLFFSDKYNDADQQYVVGKKVYYQGILLVVFIGEELHVKVDYIFGWKPLGKEMTITGTCGNNCISRIDNMRPTEIFRRYLKVNPDENFLYNIYEFPLAIERNGCVMGRVAPRYDNEGRIYFSSDVYEGEKVRLTYAVHDNLIQETEVASEYMWGFAPEAMYLVMCGNRTVFLKEKARLETYAYRRFASNLICNYGTSEIYCHHGKGGILNSALVAVGLREGEARLRVCADTSSQRMVRDVIPLSERMAAFLDAVTEELRESNRELKSMAEAAEAASRAKSQFLSNMSHEIRTPINAVLGMDEMIIREAKDANILGYAENIRTAGTALLGIINDILDFSKIEAGKMEIIPVEYAVSSLLNDLANMISQRAEKKGLEFRVDAAEDVPGVLKGDEIRLRQVVTNILTNAVKYTEQGSVTLRCGWEKTGPQEICLSVAVQDTGIGIKQEDIEKLFHAFERIEEKRNRTIEGTGLGMNITQRLLELMGSCLEVESEYGVGSVFSFKVKQQVVDWAPMGDYEAACLSRIQHKEAYRESFIAPEAKILIVDDTAMNLTVAKGLLKATQVQMDTALSGYECLEKVQEERYDLILLDHRMPGIDGVETLASMRDMEKEPGYPNCGTPVIVLTANAVSGAREEYMAAGFDDYLTKPIDSQHLEAVLQKYLPKDKVQVAEGVAFQEGTSELPDWLQEVRGIDPVAGVAHCGSVPAYLDALQVFAEAIEGGAEEIEGYYEREDWVNYTTKVHALKSSARVIGAGELSEKASRLEDAGNNGYWEEIKAGTGPLLDLYRSFLTGLAPMLPEEVCEGEKPLISPEELAEAWQSLGEVVASFDFDSLSYMVAEISSYRLPPGEADRLKAIKEAARLPDWEKLKEILG